jgi:photosystem II stability/assembly factor-like uncharacterized protein
MMPPETMKAGESRVWFFAEGVGPANSKEFLGCAKIGDPTFNFGDMERIECPDPERFNEFIEVGSFQGSKERPTASVMNRLNRVDLSPLLDAGRARCRVDVHANIGRCKNPQDFNGGFDTKFIFRDVRFTSWAAENLGALGTDEQAATNETGELSADDIIQIKTLAFGEQCTTEVAREIVAIVVCDEIECGDCDDPSTGCEKLFAIQIGTGTTPGVQPSVVFSADGGGTCASTPITTLFSNEDPDDVACVGPNLVVISSDGGMHIAPTADILAGTETWIEPVAGFVAGNGPIAIWNAGVNNTWIVGENGYIYFTADPLTGVVVQDPGVATIQNLQDVHAFDTENVVAVGDLNSVVRTKNGGVTWETIAGPAAGITMNCVWMYDSRVWLIGTSNGILWLTVDEGASWTDITNRIPVTVVEIDEILFFDDTVGYMALRDGAAHGLIARTLDGGQSWIILPEGAGTIPDNDRINMLAVCDNPNTVWGGGLAGDGTDGIILKAA